MKRMHLHVPPITRHMPPEMRVLPLDLLRYGNWPVWPDKIENGLREYGTTARSAEPLPISAARDPISSASDAVKKLFLLDAKRRAMLAGTMVGQTVAQIRSTPNVVLAEAIRNASMVGLWLDKFARTTPPNQAWPWQSHTGIWFEDEARADLLRRGTYPHVSPEMMDKLVEHFLGNQRRGLMRRPVGMRHRGDVPPAKIGAPKWGPGVR